MKKPFVFLFALFSVGLCAQTVAPKKVSGPPYSEILKDLQSKPCDIGGMITIQVMPMTCGVAQQAYLLGEQTGRKKQKDEDAAPTDFPKVSRMWITLDPVQAKYPGNEHAKPCGPDGAPVGDDTVCVDVSKKHSYIVGHFYQMKENCEQEEGVPCQQLDMYWFPVGKPAFVDETPQPAKCDLSHPTVACGNVDISSPPLPQKMVCWDGFGSTRYVEKECKAAGYDWIVDRTGQVTPAGDGCNVITCMNADCRSAVSTAMACAYHPVSIEVKP